MDRLIQRVQGGPAGSDELAERLAERLLEQAEGGRVWVEPTRRGPVVKLVARAATTASTNLLLVDVAEDGRLDGRLAVDDETGRQTTPVELTPAAAQRVAAVAHAALGAAARAA